MHTPINHPERSTLQQLRRLLPARSLTFAESLRIAELQASRLVEDLADNGGPIANELITELPRVRVEHRDIPTSGMSYWDGSSWVICLNRAEPPTRQRFTLFHEFKHILDHGATARLYPGTATCTGEAQAEQAADYFAGCALMPKRLMKRAWGERIQDLNQLAARFDVSPRAVEVRLAQLGLTEARTRCASPSKLRYRAPTPRTYFRQRSVQPILTIQGVAT